MQKLVVTATFFTSDTLTKQIDWANLTYITCLFCSDPVITIQRSKERWSKWSKNFFFFGHKHVFDPQIGFLFFFFFKMIM